MRGFATDWASCRGGLMLGGLWNEGSSFLEDFFHSWQECIILSMQLRERFILHHGFGTGPRVLTVSTDYVIYPQTTVIKSLLQISCWLTTAWPLLKALHMPSVVRRFLSIFNCCTASTKICSTIVMASTGVNSKGLSTNEIKTVCSEVVTRQGRLLRLSVEWVVLSCWCETRFCPPPVCRGSVCVCPQLFKESFLWGRTGKKNTDCRRYRLCETILRVGVQGRISYSC